MRTALALASLLVTGPALAGTLSPEGNLTRYLQEIRKFPMLEHDEEFMLAKRWREHEDSDAAHRLVTSHLRLVAKIAMGYRGYGLPLGELISEGNLGMMQAVKRFDPDKGFRLAQLVGQGAADILAHKLIAHRFTSITHADDL